MEGDDETRRLLGEIRDAQREQLAEYRRVTERSLELQQRAGTRQEQIGHLYRRLMLVGGVLVTALRWDDEYRNQRYVDEPPLPFVERIVDTLRADASAWNGTGLYVGCGNGRNYLPLVDAGLVLLALDVSA